MSWRVRVGQARPVDHGSKASVDRAVADARDRYRRGVKSFRLVRVVDPQGELTIIDFERELALEQPLLVDVAKTTVRRNRTRAASEVAAAEWRESIKAAAAAGISAADIARAAGTTLAHVHAVLARR
jgi:hypothetical protein